MKVKYDGSLSSEDLVEKMMNDNDILFYDNNNSQQLRCKIINNQLLILAVNADEIELVIEYPVFCKIVHYDGFHVGWSAKVQLNNSVILNKQGYKAVQK